MLTKSKLSRMCAYTVQMTYILQWGVLTAFMLLVMYAHAFHMYSSIITFELNKLSICCVD